MRQLATGIDLIEIARIQRAAERHGDRFYRRFFTQQEIDFCQGRAASLAGRFATKEAVAKALPGRLWRIYGPEYAAPPYLPPRLFQPEAMLRHVFALLAPGGQLLIVNQGEDEADEQAHLFSRVGIEAEPLGAMESPLSPFRERRFGWRVTKAGD